MSSLSSPSEIPVLPWIETRGEAYTFSARPSTKTMGFLTLGSLTALTVSGILVLLTPNDGASLAAAISALSVLTFGSIWLAWRRCHRTLKIDFAKGEIQISEALGAIPETKWTGSIQELKEFALEPDSVLIGLYWHESEAGGNIVSVTDQSVRDEFLALLERSGVQRI